MCELSCSDVILTDNAASSNIFMEQGYSDKDNLIRMR